MGIKDVVIGTIEALYHKYIFFNPPKLNNALSRISRAVYSLNCGSQIGR